MYWPWGQGQGSPSNHVLSSFTLTSKKANQGYMISPSLQLTRPFDVGNHVTSAFKLEGLRKKKKKKKKKLLRTADRAWIE